MTKKVDTPKKRIYRKPHKATPESTNKVKALVIAGSSWRVIANILEIDEKTLYRHYKEILEGERQHALARNTVYLTNMAREGNAACAIYLQKCLGGALWRENAHIEHQGEIVLKVVYDRDKPQQGKPLT